MRGRTTKEGRGQAPGENKKYLVQVRPSMIVQRSKRGGVRCGRIRVAGSRAGNATSDTNLHSKHTDNCPMKNGYCDTI